MPRTIPGPTSEAGSARADPAAANRAGTDSGPGQVLRRPARYAPRRIFAGCSAASPWTSAPPGPGCAVAANRHRVNVMPRKGRPRTRADHVLVWAVPAGQLLTAWRPAGQPAGAVERQQPAPLGQRLSQQHQRADELWAGRVGPPARVSLALDRLRPRGRGRPHRDRKAFGTRPAARPPARAQNVSAAIGGNGTSPPAPGAPNICANIPPSPTTRTTWRHRVSLIRDLRYLGGPTERLPDGTLVTPDRYSPNTGRARTA